MSWLSRLFQRDKLERELDAELTQHLEQHIRDLVAAGHAPAGARRRARLELGGVEQVKEETRDARGTRWVEEWWQDTRYALRAMRRAPGFTAAAVLTLAIGIGANTAVYNVVRALLLRSLPVEAPNELVFLQLRGRDGPDMSRFSGPMLLRFRAALADSTAIAGMTRPARMYLNEGDAPEAITTQLVSGDWFRVLGVRAVLGRPIGSGDEAGADGHPVVVLSHEFWTRRFGRDASVVGRPIRINGAPLTVIGVMDPRFSGVVVGTQIDAWLPISLQQTLRYAQNASMDNDDPTKPWFGQEGIRWLSLIARAGEGQAVDQAQARLDVVFRADQATSLVSADSATRAFRSRIRLGLVSAARGMSDLRNDFAAPLMVLMVTVGMVLLVACANLASLLLARGAARSHEIAVRMSLGARGGRLLRQVLTESVTLAGFGGLASLLVGYWGGAGLLRMTATGPQAIPLTLSFDWGLLAFVAGVSLGAGVLFGLAPALRMSRTNLYDAFKAGGRVTGERRGREWPLGRMLVVAQVGLSLTLVVVAAVFVRSIRHLLEVDPGYDQVSVLEARIDTRAAGFSAEQLPALYQRLLDAVRAVPGVRSASLSVHGLASGGATTSSLQVPGKVRGPDWDSGVQVGVVSEDFLATTGVRLLKGRAFTAADGAKAPKVAIVTQSMARRFFDTEDVIGRRFGYDEDPVFEVVGVVADIRANQLKETPPAMIFLPLAQDSGAYAYSVEARVTGSAALAGPALRAAITGVDRGLPVREVVTVAELLERTVHQDRLVSSLTGIFGILAALLAAIGLYGVMSYSVVRRTNELGVRLALGASPGQVRGLVLRDTMGLVTAGLVLGGVLLIPALGAIDKLVFGMSPRDPVAIGVAVAVLVMAGLTAGALPAWRASRLDPVTALRKE